MADANLKVNIVAVDKASKTLGRVGGAAEKMGKAGLVAAGGIAAFGISSVKAYSDAQQSQAKLQDTFKRFPRLANISIESLRDYNAELQKKTRFDDDAIASGQAILGQYNITGQQLKELTPLVADFAAKTGQSFEDAATAIGKGLMGSGRALKAVGIDFKDTGTQAGNLQQIMGGLRKQVGGFAEQEALTGAGAAERLKNQFGELQESVGEQLLPPLIKLAGVASDMLVQFNDLPQPVKQVAGAIALVGTATLIAAPRIAATAAALSSVSLSAIAAAAPVAALTVALAAAGFAVYSLNQDIADLDRQFTVGGIEQYRRDIDDVRGRVEDQTRGIENLADVLEMAAVGWRDAATGQNSFLEMDDKWRSNLRTLQGYETALLDVQMATGATEEMVREAAASVWDENKAYVANKDALRTAVAAKSQATEGAQKLAEAEMATADAAATAADKTQAYKDSLDALNSPSLDVRASQRALEAAYDAATEAVKENGHTLNTNTERGRANADALDNVAQAAIRAAAAQRAKDGNDKRANETLLAARERLMKQAQAMGMNEAAAKKYVAQVLKIPGQRHTKVTADVKPAQEKVKTFKEWAERQGVTLPTSLKISKNARQLLTGVTPGSPAAARIAADALDGKLAKGGPVRAGGTYLVGEKGPELFMPSNSGMIIPNGGGRAVGAGVVVHVHGSALASKQEIARVVTDALRSSGARGLAVG